MTAKKLVLFLISTLVLASFAIAENRPIPKGARLYIEEMPNDLNVYIKAEIIKKKVSIIVVSHRKDAEFVMTGTAQGTEKNAWHEGWLTATKDKVTGAVEVVNLKGELVWAGEAGDRSLWFMSLKRGGERKVAGRIAKRLKKAVAKR